MDASVGMAPSIYKNYIQHLRDTRFLILLILILALLVLTPFLDDFVQTRILMDVFLAVIMVVLVAWLVRMHVSRRTK